MADKVQVENFKGEISEAPHDLDRASRDASLFIISPQAVATPHDGADVAALATWAAAKADRSLTVRSGGTDMSGGPLTASVVVDIQKHFTRIGPVENSTVTVQPGAWYRDLEKYLTPRGLLLPSYPASKDICTVGGMVANNAGGEKTLIYGKTANYVSRLKAVLSDGREYIFRPLTSLELKKKMSQSDFEGNLYRRLFELLEKNYVLIQAGKPKVSKNSAGYALWDVWNRDTQMFDLTQLFCGSQGTLGIITEIKFRLVSPAPHTQMLVIFLRDLARLAEIVKTILIYTPEAFESYDDHTLHLALGVFQNLLAHFRKLPKLTLLAEFSGHDKAEVNSRVQAARSAVKRFGVRTRLAASDSETAKYWATRRESFNLLRRHSKDKVTAPFIDDIIVPPEHLPEFLPLLNQILARFDLIYTIAGHVGDGNFHIIPLMDPRRPDFVHVIENLGDEVNNLVLKFGGSLTAEHNDGLIRSHYLKKMFGEEVYSLFVKVKNIFDPKNIFNPGKKINSDWEYSKQHLIKE